MTNKKRAYGKGRTEDLHVRITPENLRFIERMGGGKGKRGDGVSNLIDAVECHDLACETSAECSLCKFRKENHVATNHYYSGCQDEPEYSADSKCLKYEALSTE